MNMISGKVCAPNKVRIGAHELVTDANLGAVNSAVTVGLRPTDGEVESGENKVQATAKSVEFTGADYIIQLRDGEGNTIQLRQSANSIPAVGGQVNVHFAPANVHVFGLDGERL